MFFYQELCGILYNVHKKWRFGEEEKMNKKVKAIISLVLTTAFIGFLAFMSIFGFGEKKQFAASSIRQGLDLRGGVSITYQAVKEDPTEEEMADARAKLRRRVDEESTEADVYLEGTNRINVDIPDVTDAEAILKKLGKAGMIYFILGDGNVEYDSNSGSYVLLKTIEELEKNDQIVLTGADILAAEADQDRSTSFSNLYCVNFRLSEEGTKKFAKATGEHIGGIIAIVYDGKVVSAPRVSTAIDTGEAMINQITSFEEASDIATTIRIGALPISLEEIRSTVVGAQLGTEALKTSIIAAFIGILCIIIFLCVYYRMMGVSASIALCIYTGLMVFLLNLFDVTLTLQGIAGIILSIGMAVDANVIIFQRIREELATGKTVSSAMKLGFDKALSSILDGNITTIIAAIVLYLMGSGSVKGFAITLMIGIVLSMFTALTITKFLMHMFYDLGVKNEKFYGIQKERKVIPFTSLFKKTVILPIVVLAVGIGFMVVNGTSGKGVFNFGLDFKGGTSLSVTFPEKFDQDLNKDLEKIVRETIGVTPEIVNVNGENTYIIKTTELSQDDRAVLTNALYDKYEIDRSLVTVENISGRVSSEMRSAAIKAVIVAICCMLLYIWVRFKNFNYAISSVIALAHDVVMVLCAYAILRISAGNTFIACLLTLLGYSINATIVVFDRLRENMKEKLKKETLEDVVNKSVTQSFSRCLYTTLTTVVMVVMLAILGVDSVKEFAIPMIIGFICGGYSSVCLTSCIWCFFEKRHSSEADAE